MLVALINIPRTATDWARWSFAHRSNHVEIAQAIAAQAGIVLAEYQLDPIDFRDIESWLARNQQAHADMNGVLGSQGTDLQEVDFKDERQAEAWFAAHFLEHQTAAQRLKI